MLEPRFSATSLCVISSTVPLLLFGNYLLDKAEKRGNKRVRERAISEPDSVNSESGDGLSVFFKVFSEKFRAGEIRFNYSELGKQVDRLSEEFRAGDKKPRAKRLK